ncbi:WcbI family polysaccharide biosynthesis putative acetyltransferase [Sphingomonas sp. MMS24-J13]|uniref:WcbI family polysaccharide biosynthesis putative acetyltransferase n=1 Tax=Sphingomonas sp. MMS24-J13 TaxID=3238686 RepID=UPI00384FBD95
MRIGLIGNCQVQTLEAVLGVMLPGSIFSVLDFSKPEWQDAAKREVFSGQLSECDIVFAHPNVYSHVSTEELRNLLGKKLALIGNFYFRGYFPDICYIGGIGKRLPNLLSYHSIVVVRSYLLGQTPEQCLADFSEKKYSEFGFFEDWKISLEALRGRDATVDYPIADLVEEFAVDRQIFHTVNHPTIDLIAYYLSDVCKKLGLQIPATRLWMTADPLYEYGMPPVFDFLAGHHNLRFRSTQFYKMSGAQFITADAFIRGSYRQYDIANLREEPIAISSPGELKNRGLLPEIVTKPTTIAVQSV